MRPRRSHEVNNKQLAVDVRDVIERVGIGLNHNGTQGMKTNSTKETSIQWDCTGELPSFKRLLSVPFIRYCEQRVECWAPGTIALFFHWSYHQVFQTLYLNSELLK